MHAILESASGKVPLQDLKDFTAHVAVLGNDDDNWNVQQSYTSSVWRTRSFDVALGQVFDNGTGFLFEI